jgi:hypothetical protein
MHKYMHNYMYTHKHMHNYMYTRKYMHAYMHMRECVQGYMYDLHACTILHTNRKIHIHISEGASTHSLTQYLLTTIRPASGIHICVDAPTRVAKTDITYMYAYYAHKDTDKYITLLFR